LVCSSSACWVSRLGLRLFKNARLLFQLFVGGLEFFLLHLQFFVELLGFGQHFLQTLTVTGGFNRGADVVGNQLEQLYVTLGQRAQEAQFDHAVNPVIVTGRAPPARCAGCLRPARN
jgi:hypothetical protein